MAPTPERDTTAPRPLAFAAAMGTIVAITFGLIVWLVLWAIGTKAFDAFMITVLIALVAVTLRMIAPYLPGNRRSCPPVAPTRRAATSLRVNAAGPAQHCAASCHPHRIPGLRYRVPEEGPLRVRSVAAAGCLTTALAFGVAACGGGDDNGGGSRQRGGGGRPPPAHHLQPP